MPDQEHTNQSNADSQWVVLGAGSMGCLWAAYLQRHMATDASEPAVTMLVRNEGAISQFAGQAHQVRLEVDNRYLDTKLRVALAKTYTNPITNLLVATKAFDVHAAIESVKHLITRETRIVLLQNGLKPHYDTIAQYGAERVVSISTSNGAYLRTPFHVVHAGAGKTWLGQFGTDQTFSEQLLRQLPTAELNITHHVRIAEQLWRKFAVNCSINILSALYQIKNGELLTHPQAKQDLLALCEEVQEILAAIPEAPSIGPILESTREVLLATTENYSSTLQDVRKWQRTEIGQFNRYLCAMARSNGTLCPYNKYLLERFERLYPTLSFY
jgi:2-dehydropantoate 2-reductase